MLPDRIRGRDDEPPGPSWRNNGEYTLQMRHPDTIPVKITGYKAKQGQQSRLGRPLLQTRSLTPDIGTLPCTPISGDPVESVGISTLDLVPEGIFVVVDISAVGLPIQVVVIAVEIDIGHVIPRVRREGKFHIPARDQCIDAETYHEDLNDRGQHLA